MFQHHYIEVNFVLANADPSGHTVNGSITKYEKNIEIMEGPIICYKGKTK